VPSEDMQMLLSHRELACHDEVVNGALVWGTRDTRLRTKNHRARNDFAAMLFVFFIRQRSSRQTA
jgi:hypothetical protein